MFALRISTSSPLLAPTSLSSGMDASPTAAQPALSFIRRRSASNFSRK